MRAYCTFFTRLLTALLLCLITTSLQSQCKQIIGNREITGPTNNTSAFQAHQVQPWISLNRSARLHSATTPVSGGHFAPYSNPTYAFIVQNWQIVGGNKVPGNASLFGQKITKLTAGKKYVVSVMGKIPSVTIPTYFGGVHGKLNIMLRKEAGTSSANAVPPNGWNTTMFPFPLIAPPNQSVMMTTFNDTAWSQRELCFTATDDWDFVAVFIDTSSHNMLNGLFVDDIEIYEMKPEAGNDTAYCDTACYDLGKACNNDVLNVNQNFTWYKNDTNTMVGSGMPYTVCPGAVGMYIVKRGAADCQEWDTVNINLSVPFTCSLGPDIIHCGGCVTLSGPVQGSLGNTYSYLWSTGATTQSISVCRSGQYILWVTTTGGCTCTDTINVTIRPKIDLHPQDTTLCPNSFPITLTAKPGYASYLWSTGSTTNTTVILSGGKYWVTVTDSGCVASDTVQIDTLPSDFGDIGTDTTVCEGTSITICGRNGPYKYLWHDGDTNRCKTFTVSMDMTIWLKTYTADSCVDYDTMQLHAIPQPVVSIISFGPFCENDPPISIHGFGSPDPGDVNPSFYYGPGVTGETFNPQGAGAGTHEIVYKHTADNGCCGNGITYVTVYPAPNPLIDFIGPFCENEDSVLVTASPAGGTFGGAISVPGPYFNPGAHGKGYHLITYTVTDSNGCSGTDSLFVEVTNGIGGTIAAPDTPTCDKVPVQLTVIPGTTLPLKYKWLHNGDTTASTYVQGNDTFRVVLYSDSTSCTDTLEFIQSGIPECCSLSNTNTSDVVVQNGSVTYNNATKVFDADIIVKSLGTLIITNSDIIMKGCHKILIERGGKVIIDNSNVGLCDWKGIELWGHYDNCQTTNYSNPYNNLNTYQGYLEITNSTVTEAEVGVLVGRRETEYLSPSLTNDRHLWGGGVLNATSNSFMGNYVDIIFSEYDAECVVCKHTDFNPATCTTCGPTTEGYNISKVQNNVFYEMKDSSCYTWVQDTFLVDYGFTKCHILVSEDNPYVWSLPQNPSTSYKMPCWSYLKGQGVLDYIFNYPAPPWSPLAVPPYPTVINNSSVYTCGGIYDCRIKNNVYKNNCYINYGLK